MAKGAAADGFAHDTLLTLLLRPGRRKQLAVRSSFPSTAAQSTSSMHGSINDWFHLGLPGLDEVTFQADPFGSSLQRGHATQTGR